MSDAAAPPPPRPASPPHDIPAAADLVAAVAEFLSERVLPAVDGDLRYLVLVSVNALGAVERELAAGDGPSRRHVARLHGLSCADDAQLAAKIREGNLGAQDPRVLEAVRATVRDKLAVADPRLLPGDAPAVPRRP